MVGGGVAEIKSGLPSPFLPTYLFALRPCSTRMTLSCTTNKPHMSTVGLYWGRNSSRATKEVVGVERYM